MEFEVYAPQAGQELPEIRWNYEEIKRYALERAEYYKGIAYTEDDAADMKKDRADINRFINALEAARREKKKEYMEPYSRFEAQVKDALKPLQEAGELISKGLAEIEQKYRIEKRGLMFEAYNRYVGNLHGLVPFEKTVREEFYKRSVTEKKLDQEYALLFGSIRADLDALEQLPERIRDKAALKYIENFDLAEAMREGKRLEELESAMEERRKQAEQARLEAEARAAERAIEKTEQQEMAPVTSEPEPVQTAKEARLIRNRITFEITANETQFSYLNTVLADLRNHVESMMILTKEVI